MMTELLSQRLASLRAGLLERGIELRDEIGQGATAVVYQAHDQRHNRLLVVKVLRPEVRVVLGVDRFLREIQIAAALQHPHIVPIYDSGVVDGSPFYIMPYIEGETLRQRLERTGRLSIPEALRLVRQIGEALSYAHAHGVVHRDIKPENILLEADSAVVADFGIAFVAGSAVQHTAQTATVSGRLTATGVIIGTPVYMSPEQASGDTAVDRRSDIFSLGCVLYEMLAGDPPFSGTSVQAIIAQRFRGAVPPLEERNPQVPSELSATVAKALAVDPASRYPTVEEFMTALDTAGSRRTRPRWQLAALVGGLGIVATSLLVGWPGSRQPAGLDVRRVAVAALSNETGTSNLVPLGALVDDWITDRLSRAGVAEVVTSATVVPAGHTDDGPERLHNLAAETRAGTLVSGSYYRGVRGGVEFHIDITDANTGALLMAVGPVEGRGTPERIADQVSGVVAKAVDSLVLQQYSLQDHQRHAEVDHQPGDVH